ncbi:hypothetical protein CDAR_248841 [Caerostris darwini]|uniref:Agouti signaling protein n=1 Tax=Caerostris darwini TaxID=1538125 RepID=A0AAV4VL94_9ARAC|nr:hypothetical protein CDAR_248841 [Caerostris darwini]
MYASVMIPSLSISRISRREEKSKQNSTESSIPLAIRERSRTHKTRSVSSAEHVMSRSFPLLPPPTQPPLSKIPCPKIADKCICFVTSYFCKSVSVARCYLVSDLF